MKKLVSRIVKEIRYFKWKGGSEYLCMKFFDNSSVLVHNAMLLLGGVPKRSTGADCKSAGFAFVGSNPTPSTVTKITVEENGAGVETTVLGNRQL